MKNMELTEKELHKNIKHYEGRLRFLARQSKPLDGLTPRDRTPEQTMMANNIVNAIQSDSIGLVKTIKELREKFGIQHKSYIPPGARNIFGQEAHKIGEKVEEITILETPLKQKFRRVQKAAKRFALRKNPGRRK